MINPKPAGPVGREFEYLVNELPYWMTQVGPELAIIEKVRRTLREYESATSKGKKVKTTF